MKIFWLILLGVTFLFGGALLMQYVLSQYSGFIYISVGNTTIQFSLWVGVLAIPVLVFLFLFLVRMIKAVLRSFSVGYFKLKESKGKKAEKRMRTGLIHFVEGNWVAAKKDLVSAAKDVDKPLALVNYLAAAKSAFELGQNEETMFLLNQAEAIAPENELAVALSQARIQLADKKYEQCLATLNRIQSQGANNPVLNNLFRDVYINLRDWPALVALLPKLKSSGIYSESEFADFQEKTYLSFLDAKASEADANASSLNEVWQSLPKVIKKNVKVVGLYCTLLHRFNEDELAAQMIRQTLKNQWHSGLVELYATLQVIDVKTQLSSAEVWLRDHKDDAYLLFALGKICMKNSLWGKARDYFESSLKIKERPEVYAELGALMAQLGEHEKSTALYQKGLLLKTA